MQKQAKNIKIMAWVCLFFLFLLPPPFKSLMKHSGELKHLHRTLCHLGCPNKKMLL